MEKGRIDFLKQIPNVRSGQECRHEQVLVLLIIIMGIASGYQGKRGWGIMERH